MSVSQPSNAADRDQIHFQSTTLANLSSHTSKNALMQQRFGKSSCAGLPKLSVLPSLRSFNPTETRTRSSQRSCSIAAASGVRFSKYQGLGNDFILIDSRHAEEPPITQEQAVRVCDRNFGVGGDGVIFALPGENGHDYAMRIYNSDGSEPEMCGNGIRCLAKFIADEDQAGNTSHRVHTLAGLMQPRLLEDGQVCVDMGPPILKASQVPTTLPATQGDAAVKAPLSVGTRHWLVTCVSMGNPHAIIFGQADGTPVQVDAIDKELSSLGPQFENNVVFPARTNTEFIEVLQRDHVRMLVWERGAGRTLACGTGACATLVAGVLEGRLDRICRVDLPGGPLYIEWREEDNHVYMTGPAELSFTGTLHLN